MLIDLGGWGATSFGNVTVRTPSAIAAFTSSSYEKFDQKFSHDSLNRRLTLSSCGIAIVLESFPWWRSRTAYPLAEDEKADLLSPDTVKRPSLNVIWISSFLNPGNSNVATIRWVSGSSWRFILDSGSEHKDRVYARVVEPYLGIAFLWVRP